VGCYFRDSYQSAGATYWLHLQLSNPGNYISTSTLVPVPIWILSLNKTKIYFWGIQRGVYHKITNRMAYFCIQNVLTLPPEVKRLNYYIYETSMHCFLTLLRNKVRFRTQAKIFFLFSVQTCFRASQQPSVGKGFAVWPGLESELHLQSRLKMYAIIIALLLCRYGLVFN